MAPGEVATIASSARASTECSSSSATCSATPMTAAQKMSVPSMTTGRLSTSSIRSVTTRWDASGCAREHDGELVTADAAHVVAGPDRRGQPRGHRLQHAVARVPAVIVVHPHELLEVHHHDREPIVVVRGAAPPRLEHVVEEELAPGEPGEGVVGARAEPFVVGPLGLGRDVGDRHRPRGLIEPVERRAPDVQGVGGAIGAAADDVVGLRRERVLEAPVAQVVVVRAEQGRRPHVVEQHAGVPVDHERPEGVQVEELLEGGEGVAALVVGRISHLGGDRRERLGARFGAADIGREVRAGRLRSGLRHGGTPTGATTEATSAAPGTVVTRVVRVVLDFGAAHHVAIGPGSLDL